MNTYTRFLYTFLICSILVGCISLTREVSRTQASHPPQDTFAATIAATIAPTLTAISNPTPTPTCLQTAGKITAIEIPVSTKKYPLAFKVYTPPCFDLNDDVTFPLLILFHGQSATYDHIIDLGVPAVADRLTFDDPRYAMIIVFPQEQNTHNDPDESDYENLIVAELIPWLKSNYPLKQEPKYFAAGGMSRGGGWAFRLGIDHPEIFGSIGAHSPAIDGRDVAKLAEFRRKYKNDQLPRIYMDIGFQDLLKDSARKVELKLGELNIPHEWHMNSGTHNSDYWSSHLEDYLMWYADYWIDLQAKN